MNILHVESSELTHILCVYCGFRHSLAFKLVLPSLLFLLFLSYNRNIFLINMNTPNFYGNDQRICRKWVECC